MLTIYADNHGTCLQALVTNGAEGLPENIFWIDLLNPTLEEERAVESFLSIEVPTRDEMSEIEASSRLRLLNGIPVLTIPLIHKSTSDEPETTTVTFVLAAGKLVTVRYADPAPFSLFGQKLHRQPGLAKTGEQAFLGLLEQITDRLADILEFAMAALDAFSRDNFRANDHFQEMVDFKDALRKISRVGDLATKAKECLLNLSRLLLFLATQVPFDDAGGLRIKTLTRDVKSIDEHAAFVSAKTSFLLDATLGLINVEQNNIIKIFSVAAVILLPPTLVASVYGMNFHHMPELDWTYGYPMALGLMALSAIGPFLFFRRKKWL